MSSFPGYAIRSLLKHAADASQYRMHGVRFVRSADASIPITAFATNGKALLRVRGAGNGLETCTVSVPDLKRYADVRKRGETRLETDDAGVVVNGSPAISAPEGSYPDVERIVSEAATLEKDDPIIFDPALLRETLDAFVAAGIETVSLYPTSDRKGAMYLRPTTDTETPDIDAWVMPVRVKGEEAHND